MDVCEIKFVSIMNLFKNETFRIYCRVVIGHSITSYYLCSRAKGT